MPLGDGQRIHLLLLTSKEEEEEEGTHSVELLQDTLELERKHQQAF